MAPERLAATPACRQSSATGSPTSRRHSTASWRNGQTDHDRLDLPRVQVAWAAATTLGPRASRLAKRPYPESDRVPAGEPFGSSVALPTPSDTQSDKGIGALAQWAPRNGIVLELGTTPTSFDVSNLIGALRFGIEPTRGRLESSASTGLPSRTPSSPMPARSTRSSGQTGAASCATAPISAAGSATTLSTLYGLLAGAILDGQRVDSNTQWRADAGFLQRAASGEGWVARVGGAVGAQGFRANRSHFTLGHGGYFSPDHFLLGRAGLRVARPPWRAEFPARGRRRLAGSARISQRLLPDRRRPCRRRAAIRAIRATRATASACGSRRRSNGASPIARWRASGSRACAARMPTRCGCRSTRGAGTTRSPSPCSSRPCSLRPGGSYVLN